MAFASLPDFPPPFRASVGFSLVDFFPCSPSFIRMGDKSPKANQKQAAQNTKKNASSQQKKSDAAAAKHIQKPKK